VAKQGEIAYPLLMGEERMKEVAKKPFSTEERGELLARIGAVISLLPAPPRRLLDVGCGTGWTSLFFAMSGYDVVGIDVAPKMIELAKETKTRHGAANVDFLVHDYERPGFAEQFDVCVFFDSLHHAEDEAAALRFAYHALKPGGLCVLSEPGAGHAEAEISLRAVEAYGVNERDMPPEHTTSLAYRLGFREAYAYPQVCYHAHVRYHIDPRYRRHPDGTPPSPLRASGPLKRLFHRLVRWRFGMSESHYDHLLNYLPEVAASVAPGRGLVALVK
jgi:SAM-dependent methyltransferase